MKTNRLTKIAIAAASLPVVAVHAQDLDFEIDTKTSSATIDGTTTVDASGTLIGDYDPKTNPEGTQTRAGFFGGSGNQPIDTITTLDSVTMLDAMPSGLLSMSLDTLGGIGEVSGLNLDLLNGEIAATGLSITLGFDTFRSIDPSFLYIGGIPITLPLGDLAQLSQAAITQTAPASIVLTPAIVPEAFDIVGVVPAELDMTVAFSLPGGDPIETPIESLPILVPIAGQIEIFGGGGAQLTLNASPDPIALDIPIEGIDLPGIPFELPTLGSETAGVIFTLSPQSISFGATISLDISANGSPASCPADLNNDGELNFFDVSAFLNAYAAQEPIADFDDNGIFNFFDVSAFLNAYTAGCP